MNIQEIRQKYPQYSNRTDDELAQALHNKFYSERLSYEEFRSRIGLGGKAQAAQLQNGFVPTPEMLEATKRPQQQDQSVNPNTPMGASPSPLGGLVSRIIPQGVAENIAGMAETATAMSTSAVAGVPASVLSAANQLGKEVVSGEFGTSDAADRVERAAMEGMQSLTYQPRTESGQEMLQKVGELAQPLDALAPIAPQIAGAVKAASKAPQISNFKTPKQRRQFIAEEIKSGNQNVNNIIDVLDADGNLIKNKNVKQAVSLLGDDYTGKSAALLIENMSKADKKKFNKMLDRVVKQREKGEYLGVAEERTTAVVGESIASRARDLQRIKKSANSDLRKAVESVKGQNINITDAGNDFLRKMEEAGVKFEVDPESGRIASNLDETMLSLGDVMPQKKFDVLVNKLAKGDIDAAEAHSLKQEIRNYVDYDSGALKPTGVKQSKAVSDAIKALSSDINEKITMLSSDYAKANAKFASVADPINKTAKMLGNFDLDSDLTANRAGQLARRLASEAITKDQVLGMVRSMDEALARNKVRYTDDIYNQVAALSLLDDVFNTSKTQAPFGFKSSITSAVNAASNPLSAQTGIDVAETVSKVLKKDKSFEQKLSTLRKMARVEQ